MATVRRLERIVLDNDSPHSEVECTYSVVTGDDGRKYLQVDTYGSKTRKIPGKKSQSIRFAPKRLRNSRQYCAKKIFDGST